MNFDNIDEIKQAWLNNKLNESIYSGVSDDGNTVVIVSNNDGFTISTYQSNNWVHVEEYLYDNSTSTWTYSDTYEK